MNENQATSRYDLSASYHGHILKGPYSDTLKNRIIQCIDTFTRLEQTGNPAMLYIAAWKDRKKDIWHEYMCQEISSLLGCRSSQTADTFRQKVMESRIYRSDDTSDFKNIHKEDIHQKDLDDTRNSLRKASVSAGITEAVYKIRLKDNNYIWLNDKADIERYQNDGIYISLGFLTDVTKEMRAEEERETLFKQLQAAVEKVKILSGLLPICAECKQIRDDQGYWNQIDDYISRHSDVQFSHGICPDCARKLYPDFFKK